jgi:uncharacterized membrane protein
MGPLPPPEDIQKFDAIVQGGAERIFDMAEREQAHRIEMEQQSAAHDRVLARAAQEANMTAQQTEGRIARIGLVTGSLLSVCALLSATFAVWKGADWQAVMALASLPVAVTFAKAFWKK